MKMATFTALNGGSPKASEGANGNGAETTKRAGSAENATAPPAQPPEPKPTSEVSTSQRDRENWTGNPDGSSYTPASYPDADNSHKRKRSGSIEPRREAPSQAEHERQEEVASQRPQASEARSPYESAQRDYRPYGDEGRDREHEYEREREQEREREREPWYSSRENRADDRNQPYSQPSTAAPDSAQSDEQIGDALRRATEHGDYQQTSPDGDDRSAMYSGQYTAEQRRDGVIQSDPKKRKRNFSNRTKTGCFTCRKRKKKCDEAKPECSNCIRGGFVCAGYPPQRGTWPKPENKLATIQIESKDPTYIPPGAYGMPQQPSYQAQPPLNPQHKRDALPPYRGQPLRISPPHQGRSVLIDDERSATSKLSSATSATSPDKKLSAMSSVYANAAANVFPTPISAAPVQPFPERGPKEYQRVPPLHDLSRTTDISDITPQSTTLPKINILHATRPNSPIPTPQSTTAQTTAQLALSHTPQYTSGSSSSQSRREKDEMLNQNQYWPFDKELVLERERCNAACWRFNNSTNPNNGVSPDERVRLFREILDPKEGMQISPTRSPLRTSPVTPTGRVGQDVVVEAPFNCDYGYNIHIGKNTLIGRNCTIIDACEVEIGDNVIIGPNVSIYTSTMTTDYRRRNGARGPWKATPVIIEDDVFIGGSVTILPGVRIGKGSTVGAGSVVETNQPSFCVCTGTPASVKRGIASAF